jgi:hypothetical protein
LLLANLIVTVRHLCRVAVYISQTPEQALAKEFKCRKAEGGHGQHMTPS